MELNTLRTLTVAELLKAVDRSNPEVRALAERLETTYAIANTAFEASKSWRLHAKRMRNTINRHFPGGIGYDR